ncbi:MAG: YheT family hydrolase [Verrucomicrobiales bacterium]
MDLDRTYRAPRWLPGGHLQTIWPTFFARRCLGASPAYRRERWSTPDGDFIDVDFLDAAESEAPLLVLFHGLEGSSQGAYALAFAEWARTTGWHYAVPHFRGCSGELNRAPRAYHSGDFEEVGWILDRLRTTRGRPVYTVGISLGGNALLRWAEEMGEQATAVAHAVAAVSSPIDLAASGRSLDRGINRLVYARHFLRTMKPKALAKWAQYPGLFDRDRLMAAETLYDFDNAFTAPLHGFRNTDDYWSRASAKPHLSRLRLPTLLLNARNDPIVPINSLPMATEANRFVTLWQPGQGGHVGFAAGYPPGHVLTLPQSVMGWMCSQF